MQRNFIIHLFFLILSCNCLISFNLSQIKSFIIFYGNILAIRLNSSGLSEKLRDFKASLFVSDCFSKAFPKEECVDLTFSIIWL